MDNKLSDIALRLQGIIDTAIDGIITINNKGIVETVNNAAATQFGFHPVEIIGNNIKMLMPEPYHSEHDGYLHRYNTTKEARIIGIGREVIGQRKDSSQFPFRLAVSEVILNDRVIYTGIIHDLSDIKAAEQELLELNEKLEGKVEARTNELEKAVNELLRTNTKLEQSEKELKSALGKEKELNELKSRFVSMASHEFRTPLSTIMSSASLISKYTEEAQNERRQKHVDRIKSAVTNLTGILNDFLSLSKIEEGKIILNKSSINLQDLCDLVINEVKGLLKEGQKIEQEHEISVVLNSDERILKNIFFNLISNAIKYSPPNATIKCKFRLKNQACEIDIIDQGIGIPEQDQKYMFDRFFRASNVETIQGTGLGLNIVKRYVEMLGGTITFVSKESVGTTFTITIPIEK